MGIAARPLSPTGTGHRGLPRILCVDDEPCTLSTLARVLRAQFDVTASQDPMEALALVQQAGKFAVLIADLNMPRMSGLALVEAVRSISPATTRLVLTGDLVTDSSSLHADAVFRFLSKQCPLDVLRQAVADAVGQHVLLSSASAKVVTARPLAGGPSAPRHPVASLRPSTSAPTVPCPAARAGSPGAAGSGQLLLPAEPESASHSFTTANGATLAAAAAQYFLLGQSREGERMVGPLLQGLLRYVRSGQVPLRSDVQCGVHVALSIAEATHAAVWVDYIFELYAALRQPAEQEVVERLHRVIPTTPGLGLKSYRAYLETLDELRDQQRPFERFLIQRLQELESKILLGAPA